MPAFMKKNWETCLKFIYIKNASFCHEFPPEKYIGKIIIKFEGKFWLWKQTKAVIYIFFK